MERSDFEEQIQSASGRVNSKSGVKTSVMLSCSISILLCTDMKNEGTSTCKLVIPSHHSEMMNYFVPGSDWKVMHFSRVSPGFKKLMHKISDIYNPRVIFEY